MARVLVHRNKLLARVVLYAIPVLLLAATAWLLWREAQKPPPSPWADVDWLELESVRILQDYLQIDTTHATGSEIEAAEWIARLLRDAGVEDVRIERIGSRNANLWAVLPGTDPRPLVLHQHMDTEPIDFPNAWRMSPFEGLIESPYIFGRGAFDMKSLGAVQIATFLELARSETPLRRSLMLLATGDEEVGSWLGVKYLLERERTWIEGFWAVLTEGGTVDTVDVDDIKYWGTEFLQKRYIDLWFCDASRERLEDLRAELVDLRFDRSMTPGLETFFRIYGPSRDRVETRALLAEPEVLFERLRAYPVDVDAEILPNRVEDTMRRSFSVGPVLDAPEAGGHRMHVIVHLMPDDALEDVWPTMVGDRFDGFTYVVEDTHPRSTGPSPIDHPVFQAADALIEDRFPGVLHGPLINPYVASDARFFRSAGVPSYGFSPFRFPISETVSYMGPNERIALPVFAEGAALYDALVRRLVVDESGGGEGRMATNR